jgi:transposase
LRQIDSGNIAAAGMSMLTTDYIVSPKDVTRAAGVHTLTARHSADSSPSMALGSTTKGASGGDLDCVASEGGLTGVPQMSAAREAPVGARRADVLRIPGAHRRALQRWVRAGTTPQRVVRRALVVLLAADGLGTREVAKRLHVSPHTVQLWRLRYLNGGPESLWRDAPGRGRKPSLDPEVFTRVRAIVASPPPQGGRWSVRRIAEATGLSRGSVHRILRRIERTTSEGMNPRSW